MDKIFSYQQCGGIEKPYWFSMWFKSDSFWRRFYCKSHPYFFLLHFFYRSRKSLYF